MTNAIEHHEEIKNRRIKGGGGGHRVQFKRYDKPNRWQTSVPWIIQGVQSVYILKWRGYINIA